MKNMAVMDPHLLVRLAIKKLLPIDSTKICGMLNSYSSLQLVLDDEILDAVIIELFDYTHQLIDGINFIRKNSRYWGRVKLIIITAVEYPFLIKTVMKFNPCAILSKKDGKRELDIAINRVCGLATYCSPAISRMVNDTSQNALTARELYTLTQLLRGRKVMQISSDLDISYKAVHGHKKITL
ncbi:LuxR C-terminal-related transcriptional regulator [Enterobacter hormaechei]|uniref:LuxR C-terminal-related transcriptional regulator n=1 Tax=Enterobacter hormaechei TaxID=158836 RepID=UPI0032DB6D9A